jgi:predicted nucleic acid-binding protein
MKRNTRSLDSVVPSLRHGTTALGTTELAGRKGRTLTLADTLIAATALENGCVLMTDNRRNFPITELRSYPMPKD